MENLKNKKNIFTNTIAVALSAILCCALWGSATPFIKIGYELLLPVRNTSSTILFAGIRFMLAGILTILIYSVARKKFLIPKKENFKRVATVSLFQTIIQYIFFYIGLANTTGVKGTILSGSNAFFAIIISSLIFKQEKLTFKKILACLIGFAGIVFVNFDGLDLKINFFGDGFVLFSTISYAVSSSLMKRYSKYEDPVILSGYQFALGGIIMILFGIITGGTVCISSLSGVSVLVYLSLLSAVAYALWGVLLKFNPVSKVTIYSFMIPVFGVLLSKLLLTESSQVSMINLLITLLLVSTGIIMLNYKKE